MNTPDNVDRSSIITLDDILGDPQVPRDHRIHNWIYEQCSFAVTGLSPSLSRTQHFQSNSLSSIESTIPAIRADSPLLGFPIASEGDASHDPLHFPSPTYARDLPELEPVARAVQEPLHEVDKRPVEDLVKTLSLDKPLPAPPSRAVHHAVALPPSFTRLPYQPKPLGHSPSSSQSSSIHSRHSQIHMPLAHTRTPSNLSQSSISSARLATQPLARRPSLAHQPSLPLLGETAVLSSLPFPNSIPASRSRSYSAASLSQYIPSAIQYTQSSPLPATAAPTRRQSSQSRFTSISSTLSFSSAHPSESTTSIRNAVYFDSEEVKDRLDSFLAASATPSPTLGHADDDEQEIVIGRSNSNMFYSHSATPARSDGVPPNTPTTAYYPTPYASSSQIYLGTSSSSQSLEASPILADPAPIHSSAAPPLILDSSSDECAVSYGELSTPGTSPAISSVDKGLGPYGYESAYHDELDIQEPGLAPPTSSRWSLTSSTLDLSSPDSANSNRKSILGGTSKTGKRGRLASFISRLSGIPPPGSVTGMWEPMPPTPSKEWISITPTRGIHLDDTVPPTPTDDDNDDEHMLWARDTRHQKERLSIVTALLDRDFNTEGRTRRISLSHPSSPQVSPLSAREVVGGRHRLKSMSSLGSLTAVAKSQKTGFRGLAARMGLAPSMPPPLEAGWGKAHVSGKNKKRKLVISGLNEGDVAGFDAVRSWCEGFGEVRQMKRKPNGCLHVDFRKASVAETVCRLQAQVNIKGAGSVSLSWYTKKGTH